MAGPVSIPPQRPPIPRLAKTDGFAGIEPMKKCPQCGREYDNSMMFCLDDGAELLYGPASIDEPATAILSVTPAVAGGSTLILDRAEEKTAIFQPAATARGTDSPARGFDKRLLLA